MKLFIRIRLSDVLERRPEPCKRSLPLFKSKLKPPSKMSPIPNTLNCRRTSASRFSPVARLAVTAGRLPSLLAASLLVSCQGPSSPPAIQNSTPSFRPAVTGTPRPGGATFQFGVVEVSYREGSNSNIENLLAANPPEQSLRWLSQQRGADLLAFPKSREGQSVKMEAQDFMVQLSGIKAAAGGRAIVDAKFRLPAFPDGKSFTSVSIPAGGVVLFPETRRVVTGGSPFTAPNRRVLGLVMLSPQAPPSAD